MAPKPRQRLRLALLRAFARLGRSRRSSASRPGLALPTPRHVSRILVMRPDHMGDLLFTTPALRALRQRYPKAHITLLVGPWGTSVLSGNPNVDEIVPLPFPGFTKQAKASVWQPYGLLWRRARQLRGRFDLVFVLRFDHWWGALLAYLADVPYRVGYSIPEVAPFLSHALPYIAGRHEVEQNLRLLDWDSGDENPWENHHPGGPAHTATPAHRPLEFHIAEQALTWAKGYLRGSHSIAIHPGAGAAIKLWRSEGWAAVADALASETHAGILLTGSKGERPLCQEIASQMKKPARILAGETTLEQLAAIQSQCRLVLGPDSGPLHLATAVGTPTVRLHGPVDAATFGPWGPPQQHRVLVSAWPCIPCNRLDYQADEWVDHPCVRDIGVDRVLATAREALATYGEIKPK